jgi:hypothetical protein
LTQMATWLSPALTPPPAEVRSLVCLKTCLFSGSGLIVSKDEDF